MSHVKFNTAVESKAKNTSVVPIIDGQFLIVTDTMKLMYDFGSKRLTLGDIIELDTESERAAILTPLSKFYFVKETGVLWRYNAGEWSEWDTTAAAEHIAQSVRSTDGVHGLRYNGTSSTLEVRNEEDTAWERVPVTVPGDAVSLTLLANGWNDGKQTVSVSGLTATQNGMIGMTQGATQVQMDTAAEAKMYVFSQAQGSITIAASGDIPEIDLPITMILL